MSRIHLTSGETAEETFPVKAAPREALRYWRSRFEDEPQHEPAIFLSQTAYKAINEHLNTIPYLELGGMLIGEACLSPSQQQFLIIDAILEARHIDHSAIHLTFTAESLADMHERLEANYPDKQILGWYHSHPNLSIFLSSLDLWLHRHFFPKAWHTALVVDPQAMHAGFFRYNKAHDINPVAYTGFYELGQADASSIVRWENLESHNLNFDERLWQLDEIREEGER